MIVEEEKRHVYKGESGNVLGEITFVPVGKTKIIIDHTHVLEEGKGKGIAKELVYSVVKRMEQENKLILPLCPFAKLEFEKNPDYQKLLAQK
ncbi:N-acetyltransferase [Alkalihalobacillus sp. LMS6]|uniref:GNAT family N-acetyltransferase n=1 Tax=Bacillaceae TaxID=186817 RepID=UPI000C06F3B6|nr:MULTISPECIES: GNAT family N-acetyltransferase [Bacillaceae]UTR06017.1 N-acetyltransferase [Alkalihalobacillus sp. LMS6]